MGHAHSQQTGRRFRRLNHRLTAEGSAFCLSVRMDTELTPIRILTVQGCYRLETHIAGRAERAGRKAVPCVSTSAGESSLPVHVLEACCRTWKLSADAEA